jgi:hypothetical protein
VKRQGGGSLRVRDVLRTARRVYGGQFARVAGTALVVFGTLAVVDAAATDLVSRTHDTTLRVLMVTAAAFLSLGSTFYAGLLDRLVAAEAYGEPPASLGTVLRTLPYGSLIAADLLLTLATAVASLFLLLPGLVAFTYFALAGPLVNIENLRARAALRRSAQLVRGHFWLVALLVTVPVFAESELEALIELATHGESLLVSFLVHGLFGAIVGAVVGLIEVTLAYELTGHHPSATPAHAS